MASASFQLSSDAGATYLDADTPMADADALAYVSSGTYSCKAKLASTAGVGSIQWVITSADDVHHASLPTVTANPDKSCSFSVPKTGGVWLLRCIVNGGVNLQTGAADGTLDRAMAIKVLNSAGNQEIAVGEQSEANATTGYTKAWNTVARNAGAPGAAILAATESALTAADTGSLANGTRAYVASHRSTWHLQTSDAVGLTSHERIIGSTDGRVWQRELVRSAYYELQPEWWVDPDAGSDEATGADDTHPIKTLRELLRRVAPDGVWHVSRAITVHVGNNYVGSTLPDVTFHTGTGAVTVSFVGWEANPNVNTAFTVDSAVAQDAATNAIQSVTMTASLTWAQGDIVRNDNVNGGDCYHVVGYVDVGVPERAHVQPGTDSLGGDNAANPEAADMMRKVSLAPLEVTGIRVIGGVPISIALCAVHMGDETKRTARLDGVIFRCCQLSGVRLGQGSAATTCAFKTTNAIANVGQNDASEGDSGFLYKCGIIGPTTIAGGCYANLAQCYFRSFLFLESKAQVAIADACACNVASNGGIFDIGGDDHVIDCSVAYSLFGSGHHIVTVGPAVTRGQIRLLTDGTSWGFAGGGGYDFRYDGSGAEWNQWYPWPSATAANYPSCSDLDTYANWVAAPFNGAFARNRYSDLIIVSTDPVS